jgi:eukaryotic-like serine/threonine-protein kinase
MKTEIPKNIGKYVVKAELGRGATSIVYKAQDPFNNRDLAIKVFNPEGFTDIEQRKKFNKLFIKEAAIAGKLNHPHIVNIYDAVIEGNESYIVMEIVTGTALDEYATVDKLLPIASVTQMMFKCCGALDFAAQHGIIHRDIKPANIMLTKEGEIKITDFGAALMLNIDQTQMEGVGSPSYMSPEQIEEGTLTHQTDIYSLGVVMFKLLSGRLPYVADTTYALMHKIVNEAPLNLRDLNQEIPEVLCKIVHRAIEKDTKKRYAKWSEFAHDLAACVSNQSQASKELADSEKFNVLKSLPFFSEFTDVEIWELLRISQWAKFPTGKVLMKEGDVGSSFYMLTEGEVYVTKMGKMLTLLNKGDCFGEMAYIDKANAVRSASIISGTPVTLIKIKSSALEEASDNLQLKFNRMFLKTLVRRLALANAELASLVA